jgi:TPP-dependent pyruvate/acetoin dehydrogenase alpha subunit
LDVFQRKLYKELCLIRHTETSLLELFSQGKLNGTVHTCIGQEACAVGVINAINKEIDIVFSNHRGHGHYIAYSDDVKGLIAEIMGLSSGICRGIGGSQHIQFKNFYTNGIQGAGVPIVTGMALAEKFKMSGAIAVSFIGDGTFGEGAIYEAFNIASLWEAPVLFVAELNHYAQSTPSNEQHAGNLLTRADSFGISSTVADGMDVLAVFEAASRCVRTIRETQKPEMLFLETYRLGPHSKGDDHRNEDEIAKHRKREPIALFEKALGGNVSDIYQGAKEEVNAIVRELLNV